MKAQSMHELWSVVHPTIDGELHTGDKVLVKMTAVPPALFIAQGFPTPSDFQIIEDQFAYALQDQIQKAKDAKKQLDAFPPLATMWGPETVAQIDAWRKIHVTGVASVLDSFNTLHVYAELSIDPNPVPVIWLIVGITVSVVAVSGAVAVVAASNAAVSVFASWQLIAADSVRVIETLSTAAPESPAGDVADAAKNVSLAMLVGAGALALLVFKVKFK